MPCRHSSSAFFLTPKLWLFPRDRPCPHDGKLEEKNHREIKRSERENEEVEMKNCRRRRRLFIQDRDRNFKEF